MVFLSSEVYSLKAVLSLLQSQIGQTSNKHHFFLDQEISDFHHSSSFVKKPLQLSLNGSLLTHFWSNLPNHRHLQKSCIALVK